MHEAVYNSYVVCMRYPVENGANIEFVDTVGQERLELIR